ncbi:hypothetical protein AURDEDRAFT_160627 [Auricularia subglabra TFB-10046 SS5]|nr:hypothetical protein AURDEDRAFT_160627 [Auricularia subglabra TFB-10046 SS5]
MFTRPPSDLLRTAVALVVLALKPTDRSSAAYILDLQSTFPLLPSASDRLGNELWRERALAIESERDAVILKLDSARAELRELKRATAAIASEQEGRPAKKKKTNAASKDIDVTPAVDRIASISGYLPLVESFRILSSFSPSSKGKRSATVKLLENISTAIPSASPAALPDIARLIESASSFDASSPEANLVCIRLATAAVHRLESGVREARRLVQAVLHLPTASSIVLSASLAALVRVLCGLDGAERRRRLLIHKDALNMLCWAVHAGLAAGAERVDVGSVILPDILDLVDRAGPVLRSAILTAVEHAWISGAP